jgi:MFS family permease
LVGNFMTLVPTYIGELTPKELGSRFGVYPQISVVLGVLVSFLMGVVFTNVFDINNNTILAEWQWETFWRVQLGIPLLPSIFQLFFILIGYIP